LLVIFEYLARSYEEWKKRGESPDDTFVLSNPDSGERVALWRLEGEIERTLPEVLASDYKEVIAAEKQRLSKALYGPSDCPRKLTLWDRVSRLGWLSWAR